MASRTIGILRWIWRQLQWVGALVLIALVLLAANLLWRLNIDRAETFADPVAQFKYGSTGGDKNFGFPYPMWEAMPVLFKRFLPEGRQDEGWAALGFIYEDEKDFPREGLRRRRPVGTSLRNHMGIDRVFLNCAGCHAGRVRTEEGGKAVIYAGMPANTLDLSAFQEFLRNAAISQDFTPERFLAQIDAMGIRLGFINRLALRYYGVALARTQILLLSDRFKFLEHEPTFGPGRFDTFSPAKALLNWNFKDLQETELIGVVDFPSIWLQKKKEGMHLHWDGNNTNVRERNRSAAFGTGATPAILDRPSIGRMEAWLEKARAAEICRSLPRPARQRACDARGGNLQGQLRGMSWQGRPRFFRRQGRRGGADRGHRHGSRRGSITTPTSCRSARTCSTRTFLRSASRASRRPTAMLSFPWTASGCARPTCTTARCRAYGRSCNAPRHRPKAFLRGHDVYDPVDVGFESRPEKIPQAVQGKLFCYVTHAGQGSKCPAGKAPVQGAEIQVRSRGGGICKGNGNVGHRIRHRSVGGPQARPASSISRHSEPSAFAIIERVHLSKETSVMSSTSWMRGLAAGTGWMRSGWRAWAVGVLLAIAVLAAIGFVYVRHQIYYAYQDPCADVSESRRVEVCKDREEEWFKYGSLGSEIRLSIAGLLGTDSPGRGIPYPIFHACRVSSPICCPTAVRGLQGLRHSLGGGTRAAGRLLEAAHAGLRPRHPELRHLPHGDLSRLRRCQAGAGADWASAHHRA